MPVSCLLCDLGHIMKMYFRQMKMRPAALEQRAEKGILSLPIYLTKALGTGTSPAEPNCLMSRPSFERLMNQFEVAGR